MTLTLYGISNCDTVRKARTWLDGRGIEHVFHDYKKQGVDKQRLADWCKAKGWETILNRAGTTFRKLSDSQKADLSEAHAIELMLAQPSMIKRPIVEHVGGLLIGFKQEEWAAALS